MGTAFNRSCTVLLSALLLWPSLGRAAAEARISGDQVVAILHEQGYRAKLTVDAEGDPLIETSMGGLKVFMYFYDCDAGRCGSLQFATALDLEDGTGFEVINRFNARYRYARAHLDDEMDPFLQYDFEVLHADHAEHIVSQLDIWEDVLGKFTSAVGFRDRGPDAG